MTISTVPINNFYPEVKSLVRGALDSFVQEAVLRSLQRFCREAFSWEHIGDPIGLLAGVTDYAIPAPAGTYIVTFSLFYHGRRVTSQRAMDSARERSQPTLRTGGPSKILRLSNDVFRTDIPPAADEPDAVSPMLFLMPMEDCLTVPDTLWHEWREGVVAGAVGLLMAQKGRPWFDAESSSFYTGKHASAVGIARVRSLRLYADGELQARGRRII